MLSKDSDDNDYEAMNTQSLYWTLVWVLDYLRCVDQLVMGDVLWSTCERQLRLQEYACQYLAEQTALPNVATDVSTLMENAEDATKWRHQKDISKLTDL